MVATGEELPSTSHGVGSSVSQQQGSPSAHNVEHNVKGSEKLKKSRERKKKQRERKKQMTVTDPETDPTFWSKSMDPEVWGNLPPSLTLEIYKKLPLTLFYKLREVCKDWNAAARERRCVTDPIHKPYFVLIHEDAMDHESVADDDCYLHGILTFHITSGTWRWKKLPAISSSEWEPYYPFSLKGLTFSTRSSGQHPNYQVFDAHTKKRYNIPHQPKTSEMPHALGMTVDTSVVPHSFKIILGGPGNGTQIYDSVTKTWVTKSRSSLEEDKWSELMFPKACLQCGNYMYIQPTLDTILVYSLEEDKWSTLDLPHRYASDHKGLGSWQGRIFSVTCDEGVILWGRAYDDEEWIPPLLWVWVLVDQGEEMRWEKVDEMPLNMLKWLIPRRIHEYGEDVTVHASFCDEHVLMYSWVPQRGRAFRFVLYDLATKTWEKVEVPNHSVSILPDNEKDTERWDSHGPYTVQLADVFLMASMMGRSDSFASGMREYVMGLYEGIGDTVYDPDFCR